MHSNRQNQAPLTCVIYAIVGIGNFVRFYCLRNGSDDLEAFPRKLSGLNVEREAHQVNAILDSIKAEIEQAL